MFGGIKFDAGWFYFTEDGTSRDAVPEDIGYMLSTPAVPAAGVFVILLFTEAKEGVLQRGNGAYQLVNWLTYMICYRMIQIKLQTLYFGIAAIMFCVVYSAVASVLVYKLVPKTFRIRT